MTTVDLTLSEIREYKVVEKIGEGGFGAVYKAIHTTVEREVVIKTILSEFANDEEVIDRLINEAKFVAQLEHPRIVPLYDYWQDNTGIYLVMRYLKGGSLRDVLDRQGALSVKQVVRIVEHLCEALTVAHQNGVVHRDLKPENLLLDERGNTYLADFGIAKNLQQDSNVTRDEESIVGTPNYLSPEQLKGLNISGQSDIYSLGFVVYELLIGAHPFENATLMQMISHQLYDPIPHPSSIRPDLPKAIDVVLARATEKDAKDRYSDVDSFAAAFLEAAEKVNENETALFSTKTSSIIRKQSLQTLSSASSGGNRNRLLMLQNVYKFWIQGVLQNSMGSLLIELGMEARAESVNSPWGLDLTADLSSVLASNQISILDVFDKLNGKILILGDPGGGKTTTMLLLASELISRASKDDQHPLPIIFNLSSWAQERKSLEEWLVDELGSKYQVSPTIASEWVETDKLMIFLDGLDEVREEHRNACVQAINQYRNNHGFVDIVVCSRTKDYGELSDQLTLNGAIVLNPLTDEQVFNYLDNEDADLSTMRQFLENDAELREASYSPLMLNIMVTAFNSTSVDTLQVLENSDDVRHDIFTVYVKRVFDRRLGDLAYDPDETRSYLSWLGHEMQRQGLSLFQIESLQPSWIGDNREAYNRRFRIFTVVTMAILFGVPCLFIPSWTGVSGLLLTPVFLVGGALVGFMLASGKQGAVPIRLLIIALLYGSMQFVVQLNLFGFGLALIQALASASNFVIVIHILGISRGFNSERIKVFETLKFSWKQSGQYIAIAGGLAVGISTTFVVSLLALFLGLDHLTPLRIMTSLIGASGSLIFILLFLSGLIPSELEYRTRPNQGIIVTVRNAIGIFVISVIFHIIPLFLIGIGPIVTLEFAVAMGISFIGSLGALYLMAYGGISVLQHLTVRSLLEQQNKTPRNLAKFLNFTSELILTRRVGGGYIFIHRYLLEYFAHLYQESANTEQA